MIIRRDEDPLKKLKVLAYTSGVSVITVGFGLYSYYVREVLASLFLFSAFFLSMGLAVLGLFLAWSVSEQVATWSRPALRSAISSLGPTPSRQNRKM
jgi:hypothetical protein